MASEELRKKWGTIFMGEREATVEQLDAMQEPMRREQLKREQQENYLERVRVKAAERAREILGAAYAERQKVLEEARAEAEAERQKLVRQGEALKAAGTAAGVRSVSELYGLPLTEWYPPQVTPTVPDRSVTWDGLQRSLPRYFDIEAETTYLKQHPDTAGHSQYKNPRTPQRRGFLLQQIYR